MPVKNNQTITAIGFTDKQLQALRQDNVRHRQTASVENLAGGYGAARRLQNTR